MLILIASSTKNTRATGDIIYTGQSKGAMMAAAVAAFAETVDDEPKYEKMQYTNLQRFTPLSQRTATELADA